MLHTVLILTELRVDMTQRGNELDTRSPLAIGVDYGLHVVKRVREEYLEESGTPRAR